MSDWLVAFDTDRIHDYLFATAKLKEIRGASSLLDRLNERMTPECVRETCRAATVIYSAGGGGLFRVPEADASRVRKAVERLYRQSTITASVTGACLAYNPDVRFGSQVKQLALKLRAEKDQKSEAATIPVAPYMRFCDSCGRHPASKIEIDEEGEGRPLCLTCSAKRQAERDNVRSEADPHPHAVLSDALDQLGELSQPAGYLGFVQLDGNQIGHVLFDLQSEDAYARFAKGLRSLMISATRDALASFGTPRAGGMIPYEVLLLGGDDLLLVTTADIALDVTAAIADGFQRGSPRVLEAVGIRDRQLTLAGGVVLAHADLPIAAVSDLAAQALRNAKRHCLEQAYTTGAVDFLVMTAGGAAPERSVPNSRPYTVPRLRELTGHVRNLKAAGFPTSQLQMMYEALYRAPSTATLAALSALGRAGREASRAALWEFFRWSGALEPGAQPPWSRLAEPRRTALSDLAEIFPFVHGRET